MTSEAYRYTLEKRVPLTDAVESLYLAIFSAEGVHGRAQVRLDAGYSFDEKKRTLVIGSGSPAGRTIAQIFTGLLARQFGEGSFTVEHVSDAAGGDEGTK
jgi:hypothetical protein